MTLQDHVIIWSCDFMGKSLKRSHHLAKFCSHRHCGCGDVFSLSRDLTKPQLYGHLTLWVKVVKVSHHHAKFCGF